MWHLRGYPVPAPDRVKRATISRWGDSNSPWLETGTYKAKTTRYLAKRSPFVVSLEPMEGLYKSALKKTSKFGNIQIINKPSESGFDEAISIANSKQLNFWLDGHYSHGITFKGNQETPIELELKSISTKLREGVLSQVTVCVDDIRLFVVNPDGTNGQDYPPLNDLVEWANQNNLVWTIEQDIFIAKSRIV